MSIKDNFGVSVISYEGDSRTFVFKFPEEDFVVGSQLVVHESQEALFFRDGQALDLFGAGRYTLDLSMLPLLDKITKVFTRTNAESVFRSEVYFVNLAVQTAIKWGTDSRVRFFDPVSGIHVDIGACGEYNLRVKDSRRLIVKLVGTGDSLRRDCADADKSVSGIFRSMIMTTVKTHLARTIKDENIHILEVDEQLERLSLALKKNINAYLDEYGLEMTEFFITTISTPDDDPNFKKMRQQYADKFLRVKDEEIGKTVAMSAAERKVIEAQTAAQLEIISAQGKAEAYRLQAEAEAKEMQMKGYTYAQETARQVGKAAVSNEGGGGGGAGGGEMLGNIMNLGISLGAMSGIMDLTKQAINPNEGISAGIKETITPNNQTSSQTSSSNQTSSNNQTNSSSQNSAWTCTCGETNTKNFCGGCGKQKPTQSWNCTCGETNNQKQFCGTCGKPKP